MGRVSRECAGARCRANGSRAPRAGPLIALGLALVIAGAACGPRVEEQSADAAALVAAGDHAGAIPIYERLLSKRPDDLAIRMDYALALTKADKGNAAIEQWLRILERQPNSADARYWLGIAYVSIDKVEQAVQQWVKVVEADSTHIAAHYNLGYAYVQMGLFPLAVEEWSQALLIDPTHLEARVNRGRIRVAQGDLNGGLEDFLVALAIKPEEAINWCSLGETYFLLGDSAKAVAAIDTFLVKQTGLDDVAARARKLREDILAGTKPPDVEYRPFLFRPSRPSPTRTE